MTKEIAILDLDMFLHHAANAAEKKTIIVKHKKTGWEKAFPNRTEFYGHWKKKEGGWLGNLNKSRDEEKKAKPEDFDILDVQTPEPVENALQIAKTMVEKALAASGASSYKAFMGQGDSFRVERSTLLKYKGNREGNLSPVHKLEVQEYLQRKFKAEYVSGIESDDACTMAAYKQPNKFVLCEDKDFWSQPNRVFNVNSPERGIVDCDKWGSLWRDEKGKVRGEGRIHLLWQTASQDDVDNFKAHCFSDQNWGVIAAFDALKDCKNDKEGFTKLKEIFQFLYPEPKEVVGWRGDKITITWDYVMDEMFDMARMHRFPNDFVRCSDVLTKMGIEV